MVVISNRDRHTTAISRRDASEVCQKRPPRKQRAWGMPGARCTRSLVCAIGSEYAHEYSQRVHRDHPASPRNGFTAYTALSPEIGLSCLRRLAKVSARLGASVEASGPHDLAVRVSAARQEHLRVHRIPPRVRDDREPPLMWDGTAIICE